MIQKKKIPYSFLRMLVVLWGPWFLGFHTTATTGLLPLLSTELSLSCIDIGIITSAPIFGGILGAASSSFFLPRLGRINAQKLAALILALASFGLSLTFSLFALSFFRFVVGIALGLISAIVPTYLAEISPAKQRGLNVSFYALSVTLGILSGYLLSWRVGSWQLLMALTIPFSCLYLLLISQAPSKSPPVAKSKNNLVYLSPDIKSCQSSYSKLAAIAIVLNVIQQFSGINIVVFYAPIFLQSFGLDESFTSHSQLLFPIALFLVIASAVGSWVIGKQGRRPLLLVGVGGIALILAELGLLLMFHVKLSVLWGIISFASFALLFTSSLAALPALIAAELSPDPIRAKIMSSGLVANWMANALIALAFPSIEALLGLSSILLGLACINALAWCWIYNKIPETKPYAIIH